MIGSRVQEYDYQHKTIALSNTEFLYFPKHTLIMFLPKDLIAIKGLYIYLAIAFGNRRKPLGIPAEYLGAPQPNETPATYRKIKFIGGSGGRKDVNIGVGADGMAKYSHDFSNELSLFGIVNSQPQEVNGAKTLRVEFGCGNTTDLDNLAGEIKLWKIDLIYTTKGIR